MDNLLCTDPALCSCESVIWNTPTYSLSPSVGEVLPKQQTQLSEDCHVAVFLTLLSTLQLLTVDPKKRQKETEGSVTANQQAKPPLTKSTNNTFPTVKVHQIKHSQLLSSPMWLCSCGERHGLQKKHFNSRMTHKMMWKQNRNRAWSTTKLWHPVDQNNKKTNNRTSQKQILTILYYTAYYTAIIKKGSNYDRKQYLPYVILKKQTLTKTAKNHCWQKTGMTTNSPIEGNRLSVQGSVQHHPAANEVNWWLKKATRHSRSEVHLM